ncbi:hypothetical protein ABIB37_000319 [Agrococcus sp. UYP10]|uniref:hypothetical protein n=1 Tax=Agrococcus sp. UYP10 TaxID=1756355 RepID=UPI00339A0F8A
MRPTPALPFVLVVLVALVGCGQTVPAATPDTMPPATTAPTSAPRSDPPTLPPPSTPVPPSAAPAPSLFVSAGTRLADAPRCGDGVVLAAAMVEPGSPDAGAWLEAGDARTGFEPAQVLDAAAVLCAITFRFEPDGARAAVEVSQAYVRGDGVGAAVQAWATANGYARDDRSDLPSYLLGDEDAPAGSLQAVRMDAEALGANDLAWHEQTGGFDLDPTDWIVTRVGTLP